MEKRTELMGITANSYVGEHAKFPEEKTPMFEAFVAGAQYQYKAVSDWLTDLAKSFNGKMDESRTIANNFKRQLDGANAMIARLEATIVRMDGMLNGPKSEMSGFRENSGLHGFRKTE